MLSNILILVLGLDLLTLSLSGRCGAQRSEASVALSSASSPCWWLQHDSLTLRNESLEDLPIFKTCEPPCAFYTTLLIQFQCWIIYLFALSSFDFQILSPWSSKFLKVFAHWTLLKLSNRQKSFFAEECKVIQSTRIILSHKARVTSESVAESVI